MRITFKTQGGFAYFPGLAKPFVFDTSDLRKNEVKTLQNLIDKAEFFALPTTIGKVRAGAADMQQQTMTIEDGNKAHTVKLVSEAAPEVQALFEGVQNLVTKLRAK